MELPAFALILLVELFALSFLAIVVMAFYIRKLKSLLAKAQQTLSQQKSSQLQAKKQQALEAKPPSRGLVGSLAESATKPISANDQTLEQPAKDEPQPQALDYTAYIDEQILNLRDYHSELKGGQDIALDIDPSVPLVRRVAAVRHAVLIAEREATLTSEVDWLALEARYQALLSYYEDYPSEQSRSRIKELEDLLLQAQSQSASLNKYKKLYFDLEASWHACKNQADDYYSQVQQQIEHDVEGQGKDALVLLVDNLHHSYDGVTTLLDDQESLPETLDVANEELIELRKMTLQQHQLIDDLKEKVKNANDDNTKTEVIFELESQLARQERFLVESESCIKLMEDELTTTYKELKNIKEKLKLFPKLKAQNKELKDDAGVSDVMISRLKDDIKKLQVELAKALEGTPQFASKPAIEEMGNLPLAQDNGDQSDLDQLIKEHETLKKQYADLEESYLDLKLNN